MLKKAKAALRKARRMLIRSRKRGKKHVEEGQKDAAELNKGAEEGIPDSVEELCEECFSSAILFHLLRLVCLLH